MAANLTPKSVREYIGARYVPVFSNPIEWSNTREYEPLTIVTYQGNSYTSMQYVPTGIDIDNTAFWALTGNYNAQIEQYRQEVKAFDDRITQNTQTLQAKKIVCVFGDSWSDPSWQNGSWANFLTPIYEVRNFARSGGGFYINNANEESAHPNNFVSQVRECVSTLSPEEMGRVEFCVLLGGVNDMNENAVDRDAYLSKIYYFVTQYNALMNKNIFMFVSNSSAFAIPYFQKLADQYMNDVPNNVIYVNAANFLAGSDKSYFYSNDNLHPNAGNGRIQLWRRIQNVLFPGTTGMMYSIQSTKNFATANANTATASIFTNVNVSYSKSTVYNDHVNLMIEGGFTLPSDTGIGFYDQIEFDFGNLSQFVMGRGNQSGMITLMKDNTVVLAIKCYLGVINDNGQGGTVTGNQKYKLYYDTLSFKGTAAVGGDYTFIINTDIV